MKIGRAATLPPFLQIAQIERGVSRREVTAMARLLGLPERVLVETLALKCRRGALGPLTPGSTERLLRAERTRRLAREIFADDSAVGEWLLAREAALGGRTPLQALATDLGEQWVKQLLRGMIHGVPR